MNVENFPDRIIKVNDIEYLYFGGTSYLGLASERKFQKLISNNIKKWGTFCGSSRRSNVKLSVYKKAEKEFSLFIGSEAAITVSSGMLAGRLTVDYLSKNIKNLYHYPKSHPAIICTNSKPLFIHGKLDDALLNNIVEEVVITADAILSTEVTTTSFDFLELISPTKKITLVIDESHSLGIIGKQGCGIFSSIQGEKKFYRKILVSSLGKGLGLSGGIIASDKKFIKEIKKTSFFITASGANPAYIETFSQAYKLYEHKREKLKQNLEFIHKNLIQKKGLLFNINYPVIYCKNDRLFNVLLEKNIVITSFKYPTSKNKINRIVITANHTKKDLNKLIRILNQNLSLPFN
ncbi:aminotransferase class I/II-fold pyridoxal phosphate-dependent enzyme [Lutibacter sp.]|uniref:aminotransferase class I/II-fold pyridoxal phosphate-dependent enzyme n=1 Tax=Lutibacter sp. TaxID=1925666 RepID=UPI00273586A6|nr:aminotransferase class I/II-fold pyridoxal phosphate-dependent enzyme [Lutibacter sp.]MDP3313784.1 aminotransferase class I/II-fold pyridoxal phosphate-dependent enzyme [Lutibacter sp.]